MCETGSDGAPPARGDDSVGGDAGASAPSAGDSALDAYLATTLFLDLETTEDGGIRAIGAVLGDAEFRNSVARGGLRRALEDLAEFGRAAERVAGHNLIAHDLPHLRDVSPSHPLLGLPVADTLVLSPLAFPRRPYHHLVKDYKLVSDARSDPVADARLARRLLADAWTAFRATAAEDGARVDVHRSCLEGWLPCDGPSGPGFTGSGTADVLARIGARRLDDRGIAAAVERRLRGVACRHGLTAAVPPVVADAAMRPAVAYALEWVLAADSRSVLPPWVRVRFPELVPLVNALRDSPCGDDGCTWCVESHAPRRALSTWFGFAAFRGPPAGEFGLPMQEEVVRFAFAATSYLAILPTSFGKSLCYQLPAIARHRRRGSLTVVVSPLQALMKDQVDGFERRVRGDHAAALHGMLTPPERGDVLARVRDGSVALLYAAPEQFRNRSFRSVLRSREIGAWVFDEVHCVSKWGHDFRTDYRYAARFIREFSAAEGVAPAHVECLTATAKTDVRDDVVAHFRAELGVELRVVAAPVGRDNLAFSVRTVVEPTKFQVLDEELHATLDDAPGTAIVYLATRRRTEEAARFLAERGWSGRVEAFHAGIEAPRKREIQEAFRSGGVRVICATNAFGMGIDQPDVRIVVHADVPGSLENYLQEAGRAGRDGVPSRCVLLWCPADLDLQFGMLARSRLTQRDLGQVLRAVRRARRPGCDEVVATPRELLDDERTDVSFDAADRDARTKVLTAVAWLERAEFLRRDENHTRVFQGRPRVRDMDEAHARIAGLDLTAAQRERWMRILHALLTADERQGLDLDELAEATGMKSWTAAEGGSRPEGRKSPALLLLNTLRDMARQGLIDEGLCLSAFVRHRVADASADRLASIDALESALLDVLREEAPDAAPDSGDLAIDLRRLNEAVVARGHRSGPETLRRVLHALAEDGRGLAGGTGSVALTHRGGDRHTMKLLRTWDALLETSRLRRDVAHAALDALLVRAAHDGLRPGEVLVAFPLDHVVRHVEARPSLASRLKETVAAVERALLHLHEQKVVTLQKGLAVFRQAIGIRFDEGARRGPYTSADYEDLRFHYGERVHQAHAIGEYARLGAEEPRRAAELVADYFERPWTAFVARWFADRAEEIDRATSREAYRRIVEELANPAQQRIVAAETHRNRLVLAGPGSGKTRVVVHRCAYLLLVERVAPESILVLCFNRAACHELRMRLRSLAGAAAQGVQVHTYHGLALRLTGRSLARGAAERGDDGAPFDFDELIRDAASLLRGERSVVGFEPDELRDRLLSGYEHVLVDEYQDVDAEQYELLSAVAGRRGSAGERERPATLLAVGDDDQNIYGWRGADAAYLRQFREDYDADVSLLVENYRSSAHIVAAADAVISCGAGRMKQGKPLRVDKARRTEPRGGRLAREDRVTGGRVSVVEVEDRVAQAVTVLDEIDRLRMTLRGAELPHFAVLARTRAELDVVRNLCDARSIPVRSVLPSAQLPSLRQVREIAGALEYVASLRTAPVRAASLRAALGIRGADGPAFAWTAVVAEALDEFEAGVFAMIRRARSLAAESFRETMRSETWEVPLVEVVTWGQPPRR